MTVKVGSAPAAALTEQEREIGGQLYMALGRLTRWSARQTADQFGPGVLSALGTIVDQGTLRLGELAAREGISPASLSRIIAILESKALLIRTVDPDDRRSSFVRATRAGESFVRNRRRDRGERLAVELSPLSAEHLDALRGIVAAIDRLTGTA